MKKSTLLILVLAAALGGGAYYYEVKHPAKSEDAAEDAGKVVAPFQGGDVASLKVARGGQTVQAQRSGSGWRILQPVSTPADRNAMEGIVNDLGGARSSGSVPAAAERMESYGLKNPAVVLEVQLKNGTRHTVKLGGKDFSGAKVYAQMDDGKEVVLLPAPVLTSSDKPLDELRSKDALDIAAGDVSSFELKNAAGGASGVKDGNNWKLEKPRAGRGDATEVLGLLSAAGTAKMTSIVSETATPAELEKYGLQHAAVSLETRSAKSGVRSLLVGKKDGEEYFARNSAEPTIFKINAELYKKLSEGFAELRDKNLFALSTNELSRAEIHNANQTTVVTKSGDKWTFEQPAELKGKEVVTWKFLDPLLGVRSREILEQAPAGVAAQLGKPAVSAVLTEKSGKSITVAMTGAVGDFVYARTDASGEIYKLDKLILDSMNFKAADAVQAEVK